MTAWLFALLISATYTAVVASYFSRRGYERGFGVDAAGQIAFVGRGQRP